MNRQVRVIACCGHMVIVAGLERMTFEVLRILRERDVPVHCIVNAWENHRIIPLVQQIGASWSTGRYLRPINRRMLNPSKLGSGLWDIFLTSFALIWDSCRFRPTHILVPEFIAALRNGPALLFLRVLGVKVILRLGNPPPAGSSYRILWKNVINRLVSHFVCNSRYTMGELLRCGVPASKVSYIHNTSPTRLHASSGSVQRDWRKVVFVGQLIPEKGLHVLLDAIGLLVSRGRDVRLDVVGDLERWEPPSFAGYRDRLLLRAIKPDLAGRVNFLGYQDDVQRILRMAGIHCCPSQPEQREGFGVVNLEAKMAGIPSVVTPTGALPELIRHGTNGWICSDVSADALADGIDKFLTDRSLALAAGQEAFLSLENFKREAFAQSWWEVFS